MMKPTHRKRGAWRFDPDFLDRLARFAESRELPTTQTAIIERAVTDYMDRKEQEGEGKRARR